MNKSFEKNSEKLNPAIFFKFQEKVSTSGVAKAQALPT